MVVDKKDIERIGLRKHYKGIFRLAKSGNIFKYAPFGVLTSWEFLKDFKPEIKIDGEGIYLGKNIFMLINNSDDFFYEKTK